jgi:hypothetical protein
MRVAPLAVTNAALTLCAVLTWVYGTANAQDKGILNPEPLPPLTKVAGPGTLAKELFGRKATPSPPPVRSIGFYSKGCIAGAIALPVNGETWQVMRVSRNRNWGHPAANPSRRISQARAATRAARSVFLCTAPLVGQPNAGLTGQGLIITTLGQEQAGLAALPDNFMYAHRGMVIGHSLRNHVPTIYDKDFAKEGGLLQYGASFPDMYRRVPSYVDRILRGAKPGDLPVELPTKYEFVINLKTARAIGLDVSPDMLSIADEVIE